MSYKEGHNLKDLPFHERVRSLDRQLSELERLRDEVRKAEKKSDLGAGRRRTRRPDDDK
ncbi:MAG: hypothetical protein WCE35_22525 [Bradyrhizobium sp.]